MVQPVSDNAAATPSDHRILLALKWLKEGRFGERDFQRLCTLFHLSGSRWRHLFRQVTGVSPSRWLKQMRMERARQLLMNTFLSVKEVAGKAGFHDVSHFVRDFRALYGESPRSFRLKNAADVLPEDASGQPQAQS